MNAKFISYVSFYFTVTSPESIVAGLEVDLGRYISNSKHQRNQILCTVLSVLTLGSCQYTCVIVSFI